MIGSFGRRFARVATDVVVRRPQLWRAFRPLVRRQFGRIASTWDEGRDPNHLAAYEAALYGIEAPGRALDVGTGTGDGALALARRFPATEVVGVDIAAEMIEQAQRKTAPDLTTRVRYQQADGSKLPFPDESFDLVAHANMIPFFDEVARVVAPRGYALFAFSVGARTPIYVPPERLRAELQVRGFTDFAEFAAAGGTSLLARKE